MKVSFDFSIKQKVSSILALLFILVLSMLVAIFSLNCAERVIKDAPQSKAFNIEKRISD